MRLPVLIAAAGLTLALAACNTTGSAPAPLETASSGSPAPLEGHDWFLYEDGDGARLVYGVETSDDVQVWFDCRKRSGELALSAMAPAGSASEIHLESGGETERFRAEAEASGVNDGLLLMAEAKAGEPVFQRFRRTGWLAVWQGEDRHAYASHPGSGERVESFFAFCG